MYWIIFIVCMGASLLVQYQLKSRFAKYSKEFLPSGLTGHEIAEKMLQDNGIYDVTVGCIEGTLTDHYNPTNKTLNLSREVYNGSSVAAAAVAAHECGHVVQHATAYRWLGLRSAMVPSVNIGSKFSMWLIIGGLLLASMTALTTIGYYLAVAGVALFALTTVFAFVTLPVEFNASSRALAWLEGTGMLTGVEHEHAKDALRWAARTYVVAALSSLAYLLYYVSLLSRR